MDIITVELDLVQPAVAVGCIVDEQCELCRHLSGQRGLARTVDLARGHIDWLARNAPGPDVLGYRLVRVPYALGIGSDRVEIAARRDALRLGVDDVRVGAGPRVLVALLDQQPALVAAVLAAVALDEHPATVKLLAAQRELELALPVTGLGVADRLPFAAIPQQHGARPVLLRSDHALEVAVLERMVLDVHREALVRRIEAWAFGDRPA